MMMMKEMEMQFLQLNNHDGNRNVTMADPIVLESRNNKPGFGWMVSTKWKEVQNLPAPLI